MTVPLLQVKSEVAMVYLYKGIIRYTHAWPMQALESNEWSIFLFLRPKIFYVVTVYYLVSYLTIRYGHFAADWLDEEWCRMAIAEHPNNATCSFVPVPPDDGFWLGRGYIRGEKSRLKISFGIIFMLWNSCKFLSQCCNPTNFRPNRIQLGTTSHGLGTDSRQAG